MAGATLAEHDDIARTIALLGGQATIGRPVRNNLEAHDLLIAGLPASALLHLTKEVGFLTSSRGILEKAVGISVRTLQRRKAAANRSLLDVDQSNRTWKFAEILGRATQIFGSREDAEAWMNRPAIGLNQRKPIDLLATSIGLEAVEDYLTRIEYGVYA
uniref:type II RES/Xre toxin-antitoxin system antitoxin n=1 Tax=Pararhizobium sp. IMCC3301 TaxID=3067904 RepID=UPI0027414B20|nr:antitoxin Xre/MbcA/ParS toxin-binding domain-containing protein [Pararhizobium sp. IMCC3301]